MRLLLDEMHSPAIARALRAEGIDAIAVAEVEDLRGSPDHEVLERAAIEDRVVVTENAVDFALLAQRWAAAGRDHCGIVITDPQRFDRARRAYPGNVTKALVALSSTDWPSAPSELRWL